MNQQASTHEKHQIRVLMMPDYRQDNPYQQLLANSLKTEGVEVQFPQGYRRVFPIFRAITTQNKPIHILHLHWLNLYLKGKNLPSKWLYALKVLIDVWLTCQTGTKIVWTVHNLVPHDTKFPRLEYWTRRLLVKMASRVIIHNHASLEPLLQAYQLDSVKVNIIPHGNYRPVYKEAIPKEEARKILGFPQQGKIYLSFGMIRPYKGLEFLLGAWEKCQNDQDLLAIVGQARGHVEYGSALVKKAETIKGAMVREGYVDDELIHIYYSAADIIVLPFQKILTSGSLILAMSFSKPIIAPCFPSITETLGTADWLLYDPETEQGLFNAICKSKDIDLEALSTLVKQECQRLNWDNIAQQTSQLYLSLISQEDNKDNSEVVAGANETDR
ncbi:glycosyl transferase group 1 [Halothece sp. PCC 7418]|uniref:glycosyltransferase n=1 Tax=Halothece sp. (strain PCC 7418) TaxID=65093 RepID=UPI0002A07B82|nr:glycosyltransferase [Halothece sp. PCC 7418]AFZ44923.1 glycosyl transferase group 1 [Halothece sp. PCC 7418]